MLHPTLALRRSRRCRTFTLSNLQTFALFQRLPDVRGRDFFSAPLPSFYPCRLLPLPKALLLPSALSES